MVKMHQSLAADQLGDLLLRFHNTVEAHAISAVLSTPGEPVVSLRDCSVLLVAGDLNHLTVGCQVEPRQIRRGSEYEVSLSYESRGVVATNQTVYLPSHAQETLSFLVSPQAIALPRAERDRRSRSVSFSLTL